MDRCYRCGGGLQCHGKARFWVVLKGCDLTLPRVSLNRCEQLLFEYMEKHPEERQYWVDKVRAAAAASADTHVASARLDAELWRYYLERAAVVPVLKQFARDHGVARTSMRNLAEYLLRLWAPPKPRKLNPLKGELPGLLG